MTTEKLQKVLANAGLGSRRQLEEWITAGRVSVDGKIAQLGERVTPQAKIRVDGRIIRILPSQAARILLYHKPEGEICTRSDPENRPTVFDHLPMLRHQRWIQVGRLDFNTSGLLLFTNDGALANRLMHPSQGIEREYAVRILGEVSPQILQTLTTGVQLEDGLAKFDHIQEIGGEGANRWYHVTLSEGRNREVRRLWESQDLTVSRLSRVRFGDIVLPRALKAGRWQEMTEAEVNVFLNSLPEESVKIAEDSNPDQPNTAKPLRKPQGSKSMTAKPPTATRPSRKPSLEKSDAPAAPKRRITTLRRPERLEESTAAPDHAAPKHRRITATATGTENRRSRSAYESRTPSNRDSAPGERNVASRSRPTSRSAEERRGYEGRTASTRTSAYGERSDAGNRRPASRSTEERSGASNRRPTSRSTEERSGYEGRTASTRTSAYGERGDAGNRRPASRSAEPRNGYEGRKPTTRNGNQQASYAQDDYSNASRRSEGQRFLDESLKAKRPSAKPTHRASQHRSEDFNNASRRSEGQRFLDQSVQARPSRGPRPDTNRQAPARGTSARPSNARPVKPQREVQDVVKGQLKPRKPKSE